MARRRQSGRADTRRTPTERRFPSLRAFLSGYLHQDFTLEHGSPADALKAFLADANHDEREALRRDWGAFVAATQDRAWIDVKRAFSDLGGQWLPPSRAALFEVFATLDVHTRGSGERI